MSRVSCEERVCATTNRVKLHLQRVLKHGQQEMLLTSRRRRRRRAAAATIAAATPSTASGSPAAHTPTIASSTSRNSSGSGATGASDGSGGCCWCGRGQAGGVEGEHDRLEEAVNLRERQLVRQLRNVAWRLLQQVEQRAVRIRLAPHLQRKEEGEGEGDVQKTSQRIENHALDHLPHTSHPHTLSISWGRGEA